MCLKLGLIDGNTLFIDGTKLVANASLKDSWTQDKGRKAFIEKRMNKSGRESIRFGNPSTVVNVSTLENAQSPPRVVQSSGYLTNRSKKHWRPNTAKHPLKRFTSCGSREPRLQAETSRMRTRRAGRPGPPGLKLCPSGPRNIETGPFLRIPHQ